MENNAKESIIETQKRPRGRPKTGFNKIEYIKKYIQEHKEERKEYALNYRQNVIQNNPEIKNNILKSKQKYSNSLKKSFELIKLMNQNNDISEKYKDFLSEILI